MTKETQSEDLIKDPAFAADQEDLYRERLELVRERIAQAAHQAGREPHEIKLLPVSKTVPASWLRLAVQAGATRLGENRVQEMTQKAQELSDLPIEWVVIGHLQRNKAKDVASTAVQFQALDSLRIAQALQRHLQEADRTLSVLVQVNTSGEESKSGVAPAQLHNLLEGLAALDRLRVGGLMTIATNVSDMDEARRCFELLRSLRHDAEEEFMGHYRLSELSMGMSSDLEEAVKAGSTQVRVGSAIFGPR